MPEHRATQFEARTEAPQEKTQGADGNAGNESGHPMQATSEAMLQRKEAKKEEEGADKEGGGAQGISLPNSGTTISPCRACFPGTPDGQPEAQVPRIVIQGICIEYIH